MNSPLKPFPRSAWRRAKDAGHSVQTLVAGIWGRPGGGMLTDLQRQGQNVIFIHNPKAGGTSLGKFLNVRHRSHRFPVERLSVRSWESCFSIVVVREPFERFLSAYYGCVVRPEPNGLTKRYGMGVKSLKPAEFLSILAANPRYYGPQTNWTDYPGSAKPRADLVLRFEDIANWHEAIEAVGIDVKGRVLNHHNKSERAASDHCRRLGMSAVELADLEKTVRQFFARDYEAFGYN